MSEEPLGQPLLEVDTKSFWNDQNGKLRRNLTEAQIEEASVLQRLLLTRAASLPSTTREEQAVPQLRNRSRLRRGRTARRARLRHVPSQKELKGDFGILNVLKLRDPLAPRTLRLQAYELLEGQRPAANKLQLFIICIVLINITVFVMETIPVYDAWDKAFYYVESISVCIFTLEYILRVWSIVEQTESPSHRKKRVSYAHPVYGRLHFMVTPLALVDLASILPWYLEFFIDESLPIGTPLRIFRIFRLLKTEYYFHALDSVGRVIYRNRDMLGVGAIVCTILVLTTSTILYYEWGEEDPQNFGSIPKCMFLSVLMLTGQGIEYDDKHYSPLMMITISLTAFFSVAMFSIPTAILAWGFEEEAERLRKLRKRKKAALNKAKKLNLHDYVEPANIRGYESSSDTWSESVSTDDEKDASGLFALFDQDGNNSINISELKIVLRAFKFDLTEEQLTTMMQDVDSDGDGNVSFQEFFMLMKRMKQGTLLHQPTGPGPRKDTHNAINA